MIYRIITGAKAVIYFLGRSVEFANIPKSIGNVATSPNTLKMNAVCERFNRTLQERFVNYHEDLLFTDLKAFNEEMAEYLYLYHTHRAHKGHGLLTPKQVIINQNKKCNRLWPHTIGSCMDVSNLSKSLGIDCDDFISGQVVLNDSALVFDYPSTIRTGGLCNIKRRIDSLC
ncbi:MAG: integrase core domain-containing protein [Ostreibacterium sp.]